jgi:hypothetical protein
MDFYTDKYCHIYKQRSSFMDRDTHEDSMKICFIFLWFLYKFL